MSQFPINLNLQVSGQSKLQRAITSVKQLEQNLSRIKAIDLAKAMRGPTGDKIATLVAKFKGYAKNLEQTNKKQITTIAQAEALQATFRELSANVKVGSGTFMLFNKAAEEQAQVVKKLKNEYENLVRASKGMQTVEQREAQLARREELIKKLKEQRREKEKETAARERNAKAAEREARAQQKLNQRLDRERKLTAEKRKRQRGRAIGDFAASVGFPMLFGGGIGSIAGGAIGSIAGSATGIGFGAQIIGSALGQSLDQAAQAANKFALEATKAGTSISTLIQGFGIRGTGAAQTLNFAQTLGIGSAARQAAGGTLESIVGKQGVSGLEKLAQSSEDASNALSRFGAATTSFFAPFLTGLNNVTAAVFGGISPLEQRKRAEESLATVPTRQRGSANRRNRLNTRIAEINASPEFQAQLELEEKITAVVDSRKKLAEDAARVEGIRLTARRDTFAFEQGTLKVQAEQNKLQIIEINLQNDQLNPAKRKELELEQEITKQAIRQAEEARKNAVIEAKRRIQREQMSSSATRINDIDKLMQLELEMFQVQVGRFTFIEDEFDQLTRNYAVRLATLNLEEKSRLIGLNEPNRVAAVVREFKIKRDLAAQEHAMQVQATKNAKIANDVNEIAIRQALELESINARIEAQRQIQSTSPFANEGFLMNPLFGNTGQLQANQELTYATTLEVLNKELANVRQKMEEAAPGAFALNDQLKKQETQIKNAIANYKMYQPAVDEAALAQARFNDAMAITVPVTDSLFDNLLAVAEGTKTAEQAFADFLRTIADMLFDVAKQMIATYIAVGIARRFAGIPGSGGEAINPNSVSQIQGYSGIGASTDVSGFIPRANGGPVGAGQAYLVGERGPELFVPGAQGNIVPNSAMGSANVTVNVDASGSSVEGDGQNAAQLGKAIGLAVQAELLKQQRPGGILAR